MTITRYLDSDLLPVFHARINGVSYLAWRERVPVAPSSPYGGIGWESSRMIGSIEDNELAYPEELKPESNEFQAVADTIERDLDAGYGW